jgi:tetratricopeptide (TPR) repeat protein
MKDSKTAALRLRQARREVGEVERKEPLRRRLLVALGATPSTPTTLGKSVGARTESVSRKLADMRKEGLVTAEKDSDDRRQWKYSLTPEGRSTLGEHLAFGKAEKAPPPPNREEADKFLREALAGAVAMRRRANRLQPAIDRLEKIYAQAEVAQASGVALEALAELATTQRQDRQHRSFERSLAILDKIALGTPGVDSELVFPAIAHLEYERGRAGELSQENAGAMARHLTAAISLFSQLTEHQPNADIRSWRTRQAWSVVSLAGNLRGQSQYEDSLRYAASALQMFDELDDHYGSAQCWFLFGFCLRLLRRFDEAWSCLEHAHEIAADPANSFERARSNCLMQMGEVRRCQGRTEEARDLLGEAFGLAQSMDLLVTQAFATSALGAVEFQERDFEHAQATLKSAQTVFDRCKHQEGIALNARRQATVARHLSGLGKKPNTHEVKALIRLAESNYKLMDSPAGIAACEIERGWMRKFSPSCGKVEPVIKRLSNILEDSRQRRSLKLDAWLPGVLNDFAKEVDGELAKKATKVYSAAKRQLEENGIQGVESVSEVTGRIKTNHGSQPTSLAIEMGGESRRKQEPLAVTAA